MSFTGLRRPAVSREASTQKQQQQSIILRTERHIAEELYTQAIVEKEILKVKSNAVINRIRNQLQNTEAALEQSQDALKKFKDASLNPTPVTSAHTTPNRSFAANTSGNGNTALLERSPISARRSTLTPPRSTIVNADVLSRSPMFPRAQVESLTTQRDTALRRVEELERELMRLENTIESLKSLPEGNVAETEAKHSQVIQALQGECIAMQEQVEKLVGLLEDKTNEVNNLKSSFNGWLTDIQTEIDSHLHSVAMISNERDLARQQLHETYQIVAKERSENEEMMAKLRDELLVANESLRDITERAEADRIQFQEIISSRESTTPSTHDFEAAPAMMESSKILTLENIYDNRQTDASFLHGNAMISDSGEALHGLESTYSIEKTASSKIESMSQTDMNLSDFTVNDQRLTLLEQTIAVEKKRNKELEALLAESIAESSSLIDGWARAQKEREVEVRSLKTLLEESDAKYLSLDKRRSEEAANNAARLADLEQQLQAWQTESITGSVQEDPAATSSNSPVRLIRTAGTMIASRLKDIGSSRQKRHSGTESITGDSTRSMSFPVLGDLVPLLNDTNSTTGNVSSVEIDGAIRFLRKECADTASNSIATAAKFNEVINLFLQTAEGLTVSRDINNELQEKIKVVEKQLQSEQSREHALELSISDLSEKLQRAESRLAALDDSMVGCEVSDETLPIHDHLDMTNPAQSSLHSLLRSTEYQAIVATADALLDSAKVADTRVRSLQDLICHDRKDDDHFHPDALATVEQILTGATDFMTEEIINIRRKSISKAVEIETRVNDIALVMDYVRRLSANAVAFRSRETTELSNALLSLHGSIMTSHKLGDDLQQCIERYHDRCRSIIFDVNKLVVASFSRPQSDAGINSNTSDTISLQANRDIDQLASKVEGLEVDLREAMMALHQERESSAYYKELVERVQEVMLKECVELPPNDNPSISDQQIVNNSELSSPNHSQVVRRVAAFVQGIRDKYDSKILEFINGTDGDEIDSTGNGAALRKQLKELGKLFAEKVNQAKEDSSTIESLSFQVLVASHKKASVVRELETKVDMLLENKHELERRIEELMAVLNERDSVVSVQDAALHEQECQFKELQEALKSAKAQLCRENRSKAEFDSLTLQVEQQVLEIATLKSQLAGWAQKYDELRSDHHAETENAIRDVNMELSLRIQEVTKLHERISDLEKALATCSVAVSRSEPASFAAESSLFFSEDPQQDALSQVDVVYAHLLSEIELMANSRNDRARARCNACLKALDTVKGRLLVLHVESVAKTEENTTLRMRADSLLHQRSLFQTNCMEAVRKYEENRTKFESEIATANSQLATLQKEISELRTNYAAKCLEASSALEDRESLQNYVSDIQAELDDAHDNLRKKNVYIEEELSLWQAKCEDYRSQLESQARNVAEQSKQDLIASQQGTPCVPQEKALGTAGFESKSILTSSKKLLIGRKDRSTPGTVSRAPLLSGLRVRVLRELQGKFYSLRKLSLSTNVIDRVCEDVLRTPTITPSKLYQSVNLLASPLEAAESGNFTPIVADSPDGMKIESPIKDSHGASNEERLVGSSASLTAAMDTFDAPLPSGELTAISSIPPINFIENSFELQHDPINAARSRVVLAKNTADQLQFRLAAAQEKAASCRELRDKAALMLAALHPPNNEDDINAVLTANTTASSARENSSVMASHADPEVANVIKLIDQYSNLALEAEKDVDDIRTRLVGATLEIDEATVALSRVLAREGVMLDNAAVDDQSSPIVSSWVGTRKGLRRVGFPEGDELSHGQTYPDSARKQVLNPIQEPTSNSQHPSAVVNDMLS